MGTLMVEMGTVSGTGIANELNPKGAEGWLVLDCVPVTVAERGLEAGWVPVTRRHCFVLGRTDDYRYEYSVDTIKLKGTKRGGIGDKANEFIATREDAGWELCKAVTTGKMATEQVHLIFVKRL